MTKTHFGVMVPQIKRSWQEARDAGTAFDPHTHRVARWLLADGLLREGQVDDALAHATTLAATGSSLLDPLLTPIVERLHTAKLRLTVPPIPPNVLQGHDTSGGGKST